MAPSAQPLISISPSSAPSSRALRAIHVLNAAAANPKTGPSVDDVNQVADQDVNHWKPGDADPNSSDLVNILIKNNWDIWGEKLLKNKFCQDMATQKQDGSAGYKKVYNGFKWYTVQDYKYCQQLLRYDAERMSKAPSTDDLMQSAQHVYNDLEYAQDTLKTCTGTLDIPEADVNAAETDSASAAYSSFEFSVAERQDWVNSLVAMIPCIQVYYVLGKAILKQKPDTSTVWYANWILPNSGNDAVKSCQKQMNFFKAADSDWHSSQYNMNIFNQTFREACQHEMDFFNFGENPKPIGPDN
ncbi:heme oxygenase-like protein [Obba rivulosa]|uniref:Heme oxygenase-like protein n=1 Tax=Obba rivulosa TaxID=1052685 RepID=A0A8E2AQT9_9APHY|nr:heme oxygenase-like protein [Obba rivulosa]